MRLRISTAKARVMVAMVLGIATGAVILGSPSYASSAHCEVRPPTVGGAGICQTATVRANASGHYIHVRACAGGLFNHVIWRLVDVTNGITVRQGEDSAWGCSDERVSGLFASYDLELVGSVGADGSISN